MIRPLTQQELKNIDSDKIYKFVCNSVYADNSELRLDWLVDALMSDSIPFIKLVVDDEDDRMNLLK